MAVKTIAILSPGNMGHAVGRSLNNHGLNVITCLNGRSERTRKLAQKGNIQEVSSLEEMVSKSDLILSILVPAEAINIAQQVSDALRSTKTDSLFADCNATSPRTAKIIDSIITDAGGRFIDASIIGGPPNKGSAPRFYASGKYASIMSDLDGKGIFVRLIGTDIGRASGIKMCYAALTKGTSALHVALLTAAHSMGLSEELRTEFFLSQPDIYKRMEAQVPLLPANAFRWIGEMEEIADTFDQVGVTPYFHHGAAETFRLLSETHLAKETPESIDQKRTLTQTISIVARSLIPKAK